MGKKSRVAFSFSFELSKVRSLLVGRLLHLNPILNGFLKIRCIWEVIAHPLPRSMWWWDASESSSGISVGYLWSRTGVGLFEVAWVLSPLFLHEEEANSGTFCSKWPSLKPITVDLERDSWNSGGLCCWGSRV